MARKLSQSCGRRLRPTPSSRYKRGHKGPCDCTGPSQGEADPECQRNSREEMRHTVTCAKTKMGRQPQQAASPRDARISTTKWARRPQQAAQAARRVHETRRSPCKIARCPGGQRKQVREHDVLHEENLCPGASSPAQDPHGHPSRQRSLRLTAWQQSVGPPAPKKRRPVGPHRDEQRQEERHDKNVVSSA